VPTAAESRGTDRAFLGLAMIDGRHHGLVRIGERHLTPDGRFYGGAGIALAGAALEAACERRLRWLTTQFVGTAGPGDSIEVSVEIGARGRRSSQALVVGRVEGRVLFNAVGAADDGDGDGPEAAFAAMPEVAAPEDCPTLELPLPPGCGQGHLVTSELRDAGPAGRSGLRIWVRLGDHDPARPALLGYIADYLPLAIMRALRAPGAGASLDNTIRVGRPPAGPVPWVLVDLVAELVSGGYGHGTAWLWSAAGEPLGIASQTARLHRLPG